MSFNTTAHEQWLNDNADRLRYEFPLNENSIVVDAGGYKGEWAAKIFEKYKCSIHVFEPIQSFCEQMSQTFSGNNKIIIHNFAVGNSDSNGVMYLHGDATNAFEKSKKKENVKFIDFNRFLADIECIDLMKINIEGGEYDLLNSMITQGTISKVKNILVQFHNIGEYFESQREAVCNELKLTHRQTFNYPFIWENWQSL